MLFIKIFITILQQKLEGGFMKKIFFIFISFLILWGCTPAEEKQSKTATRKIHGIAAIGAFIEAGAIVQVRPASVDGITPENLIEGTVGENGEYSITIPETIPYESEKTMSKISTDMENGTGFIIRVWSQSAVSWVYSYSENNDSDTVSNVNPYTDLFIRKFYNFANNQFGYNAVNIDTVFPDGKFSDGTPINVPTLDTVNNCMEIMAKLLYRIYDIPNIQNALNDSWQINIGLDALLTAAGRNRLNEFLQYEFEYLLWKPDFITDGYAEQPEIGQPAYVEIWTTHGDTGTTIMRINGIDYIMNKESDSINGANHFKGQSNSFDQFYDFPRASITFSEDGYNAAIAIRRQ